MQWIMEILQLAVAGVILAIFIYVQFFSTSEKRGPLPRSAPGDSVTRRIDRRELVRGERRLENLGSPSGTPERRSGPRRVVEGASAQIPVKPVVLPVPKPVVVPPTLVSVSTPGTPVAPALPAASPPRSIADLYVQAATIAPAHTYSDRRNEDERRLEQQGPPYGTQERRQGPRRMQDTVNPAAYPWMSETDSPQLRQRAAIQAESSEMDPPVH